jgi:hypothetical protein
MPVGIIFWLKFLHLGMETFSRKIKDVYMQTWQRSWNFVAEWQNFAKEEILKN